MPRRAAVRSRGGPQSRFAAEARVRLRALRSPRPGVLTIACRTRAAQALAMAKVNEWDIVAAAALGGLAAYVVLPLAL